jgi:hypothetical protein
VEGVTERDRLRAEAEATVDAYLADLAGTELAFSIDRDPDTPRWYIRLRGAARDMIAIWLTLRDRTLHHETYLMPPPEGDPCELWRYLLRANRRLSDARFCLGAEDHVYLIGEVPLHHLDAATLDSVVGLAYETIENHFDVAMRIVRRPT